MVVASLGGEGSELWVTDGEEGEGLGTGGIEPRRIREHEASGEGLAGESNVLGAPCRQLVPGSALGGGDGGWSWLANKARKTTTTSWARLLSSFITLQALRIPRAPALAVHGREVRLA